MNIEEIIKKIESEYSKEEAFFVFNYGEYYQDNEHINANLDGIKMFASRLLRIGYNIDPKKSENDKNIFPLDASYYLPDEGNVIHYINLSPKKRSDYPLPKQKYKDHLLDKLIPIGCVILGISMLVLSIIGVISLFS